MKQSGRKHDSKDESEQRMAGKESFENKENKENKESTVVPNKISGETGETNTCVNSPATAGMDKISDKAKNPEVVPQEPLSAVSTRIRALLTTMSLCTLCGVCRPYCPTWRYSRWEDQSPRGRLLIAERIFQHYFQHYSCKPSKHSEKGDTSKKDYVVEGDEAALAESANRTMYDCMLCGRCVSVCPAEIDIPALIIACRDRLNEITEFAPVKSVLDNIQREGNPFGAPAKSRTKLYAHTIEMSIVDGEASRKMKELLDRSFDPAFADKYRKEPVKNHTIFRWTGKVESDKPLDMFTQIKEIKDSIQFDEMEDFRKGLSPASFFRARKGSSPEEGGAATTAAKPDSDGEKSAVGSEDLD
ncbi:MAG: (Fe-S)-binding protein, partial [Thermoplasmata archaeon]